MPKVKIVLNNKSYFVEKLYFDEVATRLRQGILATMAGDGASINLCGLPTSIDSTKLAASTTTFISKISNINGHGPKIVINGVEYRVDSAKADEAASKLATALDGLQEPASIAILGEAILGHSILGNNK